jgi:hypothetical protein
MTTRVPRVPSNTALLTDAFHSALRATHGAAKRERWASASGISPNDCFPPPLSSALGRSDPTRLQ